MTIKQNGGVFGRNPTFNDVTIEGDLIINGEVFTGLDFQGSWNASTNSPTLASSVGTNGEFYIVSIAGTTDLNGITNWGIGDWAIFNGTAWQRVEGGADGNFDDLTANNLTVKDGGIIQANRADNARNIQMFNDNNFGIIQTSNDPIKIDSQAYTRFDVNGAEAMRLNSSLDLNVVGALSKGSGSFKIDHPLPAKTKTHNLVHSFVESPQADNIYRGKAALVGGSAEVNIDAVSGMSEGTYVLLNANTQCFTSNESGWTAVKGSVVGNILTIKAQDSCSDTVSWLVVGERHDQHMLDTGWTDNNGKVIVEPKKIQINQDLTTRIETLEGQ